MLVDVFASYILLYISESSGLIIPEMLLMQLVKESPTVLLSYATRVCLLEAMRKSLHGYQSFSCSYTDCDLLEIVGK